MWSNGRTDDIVRRGEVYHPCPQRFVHGIAKSAGAGFDGNDLSTEKPHAKDVEGLTANIFLEKG
jgi:hypothetical protein